MKITKLPDKYDMKNYYKEEALKGCDRCPFCDEELGLYIPTCTHWYGRKDECEKFSLKKLKPQKYKHWEILHFMCRKCGAQWDSEPYEYRNRKR